MKTVALISGGKDSCFNMVQCVAEGHHIVALANLQPQDKDELDSYMYQTVGHQAIELYAEAMGLPLYRHVIQGTALDTGRDYIPQDSDEVEDLYQLLSKIQKEMDIEAVAVGAILSDYQRVRVESVCTRLALTPLAYLWRRQQDELLMEMVECQMEAIIIKVAALGLMPEKHLGLSLKQIYPHMMNMHQQYGLNVCGEGGEYETFTLDCPLFYKKIVVDDVETVIHSADAFAPVGYLRFRKIHLEDKGDDRTVEERVRALPLTTSQTLMATLRSEVRCASEDCASLPALHVPSVPPLTGQVPLYSGGTSDYFSVGPVVAVREGDLNTTCHTAMEQLKGAVESLERLMSEVYAMSVYVSNMSDFASINAVYKTYFGLNPPVRICIGACLPEGVVFAMDCQGWRTVRQQGEGEGGGSGRSTMHVQGISHWAPANIGPYSQATEVDRRVFVAGQIPLVPGTMRLVTGDPAVQCCLSLRHTVSVLRAMCPRGRSLRDVLLCVCYVTHPDVIHTARQQWQYLFSEGESDVCVEVETGHTPIVEYVVVPSLPRAACVEWQVYSQSEDVHVEEVRVKSTHSQVHTQCLYSDHMPSLFTSSTKVCFQGEDKIVDVESAITTCLDSYCQLLIRLERSWNDVPLLRLFFPTQRFSYSSIIQAWTKGMERLTDRPVPVSLVPVLQLGETNTTALLLCH
ncbi:uncharacterized protein LOC143281556 [Babylonia areolata]|uniref:uncharacterized protein LOC143281556 n=1 Tax=Babylonia areolata TaxID=304850 RepID=UPI003FCF4D7A